MNGRLLTLSRRPSAPLAALALAISLLGWMAFDPVDHPVELLARESPWVDPSGGADPGVLAGDLVALRKENRALQAELAALRPRGAYVVVDRANNRIFLRRGDAVVVEAPASTGSRAVLREMAGERRTWTFDTPPGRFRILAERPDPVWTKPDWAFLEEGKPIPRRVADRREYGSLGEYALDLGDGYMIHGTLYERLLGRSVTHGCVRVGREALRVIAAATGPGSQVFIY